jgi:hypothetical protein
VRNADKTHTQSLSTVLSQEAPVDP